MKHTLLFLSIFFSCCLHARNGLSIFTENGALFTLYVNGERVNDQPLAKVESMHIYGGKAAIRIVFDNELQEPFLDVVRFYRPGIAQIGKLKMTKRGYKLKKLGHLAVTNTTAPDPSPSTYEEDEPIVYTPQQDYADESDSPSSETPIDSAQSKGCKEQNSKQVERAQRIKSGWLRTIGEEVLTSVMLGEDAAEAAQRIAYSELGNVINRSYYTMEESASATYSDAEELVEAMEAETFPSNQLLVGKRGVEQLELEIYELRELVEVLQFESDRLHFLQHAYPSAKHPEDYLELSDLLKFDSSKMQLQKFVAARQI